MKTERRFCVSFMLTMLLPAMLAVQPTVAEDTATAKENVVFEDGFKGKLADGWSWLREDSDAWRLKDDALEIRVQPGVANSVKNALLREAPNRSKGTYAINVTVTSNTPPSRQYEQAGITWYNNGRPVFKLVKELIDGKTYIIPGKKPMSAKAVQLRLIVTADSWTAQYRPGGKGEYLTAGKGKLPPPGKDQVSIQCYNGPADAKHWIRFDDFRIVKLSRPPALRLDTADVTAITKRTAKVFEAVADGSLFKLNKVIAFEEHPLFVYILGDGSKAGQTGSQAAGGSPVLATRRVILLKPSTVVVDDCLIATDAAGPSRLVLDMTDKGTVQGRRFCVSADGTKISSQELPADDSQPQNTQAPTPGRLIHVFQVPGAEKKDAKAESKLVSENGQLELTTSDGTRTFRLSLPPSAQSPAFIEIVKTNGEQLLGRRLLPAGVMPHGPEGMKLLGRWDSAYHNNKHPGWNTRRTATELKNLIEKKTVKPGRALVLGCGTGTNAIYLAKQGFKVTALDIAPTALSRAAAKAEKAGVKVNWTLADVTAPPDLGTFDFIFDRGCYHGVRRGNAAGYVAAVKQLSHPGTRILILAGNANEERHYGPPRVKEEELRGDFSKAFEFESLRETRFDSANSTAKGPLAWAVLLRRVGPGH